MHLEKIIGNYKAFFRELLLRLNERGIVFHGQHVIDHICYRVDTDEAYREVTAALLKESKEYVETSFGGRAVGVFVLKEPLRFGEYEISVIEVPAPKASAPYPRGLEHFEVALGERYLEFRERYREKAKTFDGSNPRNEIMIIAFDNRCSVRFHERPIRGVLEEEGLQFQTVL